MANFTKQILFLGSKLQVVRSIQTTAAKQTGIKKWAFTASGYNKYGLLTDDLFHDGDENVAEAVRRLPQNVRDERNHRMLRAIQLNIQKSILPKEQWTKYEDDVPYLQPYLKEVEEERLEIEQWEATH